MRFDEIDSSSPNQLDFVPRERRNQSLQLIVAFVVVMALIFIVGCAPSLHQSILAPLGLVVAVGALCVYVVLRQQQNLDLVMTTEYQSLLLSQALALGASFCIFVKRDGTIVYSNDGLKNVFGPQEYAQAQALETVFAKGGVSAIDRERITGAIYNNAPDRVVFPLTTRDGRERKFVLTIEPFARPSGYLLVRGREYRDERSGLQLMPDLLRATTPAKLDHLLSMTPIAHYATDAFGRLEYVTPAFERALGFESGEVQALRLALPSILYKVGEHAVSSDYILADYAGEAVLQQKSQGLLNCLLFQSTIRDERGKVTGATGSIVTNAMLNR